MAVATRERPSDLAAEWPFVIELIPVEQLMADMTYQRPRQDAFVTRIAGIFDPALVGTLDVATRPKGLYALMDGQQRAEILKEVEMHSAWCAVYPPMTVGEEASFFYRKNRDRRGVHPYYALRARRVAGDKDADRIFRIVNKSAFTMTTSYTDIGIQAIKAVEDAYSWSSPARKECLTKTLETMEATFLRRTASTEAEIIRGIARFWQAYFDEEVDLNRLYDAMQVEGPLGYLGRARDKKVTTMRRYTIADIVAREIVADYNRADRSGRLDAKVIHKPEGGRPKIKP